MYLWEQRSQVPYTFLRFSLLLGGAIVHSNVLAGWKFHTSIPNCLHKLSWETLCWAPCWGPSLHWEPSQDCKILGWNRGFQPLVPCCQWACWSHKPPRLHGEFTPLLWRNYIQKWEAPSLLKTKFTTCGLSELLDIWVHASTYLWISNWLHSWNLPSPPYLPSMTNQLTGAHHWVVLGFRTGMGKPTVLLKQVPQLRVRFWFLAHRSIPLPVPAISWVLTGIL